MTPSERALLMLNSRMLSRILFRLRYGDNTMNMDSCSDEIESQLIAQAVNIRMSLGEDVSCWLPRDEAAP